MKKIIIAVAVLLLSALPAKAAKADPCIGIQSGEIESKTGEILTTGYDAYGYNYQAHMFNGLYENFSRPGTVVEESDTHLIMKWNDAWLSNSNCDSDKLLDRHFGYTSYIGSGAWLTNEMRGTVDGKEWTYFSKIAARPSSDYVCEENGGYTIWGEFCVVQEVYGGNPELNEPYGNGVDTHMKPTGFGIW